MTFINRTLQLKILQELEENSPRWVNYVSRPEAREREFQANLYYLRDHGLIETKEGNVVGITSARLTAPGADFLEGDGGIGAILKTITVKFDNENIRSLLQDKIISSHLFSPEEKQSWSQKVKGLSGNALNTVISSLIEKAMQNPQILLDVLGKAAG